MDPLFFFNRPLKQMVPIIVGHAYQKSRWLPGNINTDTQYFVQLQKVQEHVYGLKNVEHRKNYGINNHQALLLNRDF